MRKTRTALRCGGMLVVFPPGSDRETEHAQNRPSHSFNSIYPSCVKHTFADPTLLGYSLWGCGKIATTDLVLRSATDGTSTTTSRSTSINIIPGPDTTTAAPTPQPPPQDQQGPPLGAIIGGAVGGFAALAILGFAIFFLVRRSKRTGAAHPLHQQQNGVPGGGDAASPGGNGGPTLVGAAAAAAVPAPGSPSQQGHPPQMAEGQHGPYGFAPVLNNDPRASMAKPPYSVTNSVCDPANMSPPHSPIPAYPTPSPPPPSQSPIGQAHQPFGAAWAMPQQQQQGPPGYQQHPQQQHSPPQQFNPMPPPGGYPPQQYHQPHQGFSELATERGDSELRELPS